MFNSKKKYSTLSKMVFDDLNRISEIPIHRTSKKYRKIGSGVVYFITLKIFLTDLNYLADPFWQGMIV